MGTVQSPPHTGDGLGPTCNWTSTNDNGYPCHATCFHRGCRDLYKAGGCDCSTCADDKLYVNEMLDILEETFCVDKTHIHR